MSQEEQAAEGKGVVQPEAREGVVAMLQLRMG